MSIRWNALAPAALVALALSSPALAQAEGPPPPAADGAPAEVKPPTVNTMEADRVLMRRLTRQVQRIDGDLEKLMEQAMDEARENEGQAQTSTKAELLALRDERDRLYSRMLILSMRHGWRIPDLDKSSAERSGRAESEASVFGAVDRLVQKRFQGEARSIARRVRLPVISLESMER